MSATTEHAAATPMSGEPPKRWTGTAKTLAESLWFPALFFFGFLFCYLLAFHNPTPHHIRVAVPASAAAELQTALDRAVPDGFTMVPVDGGTDALRNSVTERRTAGAFLPDPAEPTLYVAKAGGFELVAVLAQVFTPVAAELSPHAPLTTVDLAPTASEDGMGTSLFYLCLGLTIPSYIMVMMLLRATSLDRKRKIATIVVSGAVASVVGYYVALAMGCIVDKPLCMVFMFMLTQAVGLTCYGLVPFVRQFFPGVAIVLFVLLSMPSSGGAIPLQMVPAFFRRLHPFMPLGNLIDALRGEMYFDGRELFRPLLALGIWIAVGIGLLCLGHLVERRRIARAGEGGELTALDLEAGVEDPALEMPRPMPVTAHRHYIGASDPMLAGRIQDTHSQPLHGVVITVTTTDGRQLTRTRTNEHGEYKVTGLPEGYVNVVAGGANVQPSVERVLVQSGHLAHQDFALLPRLTDTSGN